MHKLLAAAVLALGIGPVAAHAQQPVDVKIKGPTRLDWEFVARQFGPDQARLPADYDSTKQRYQLFVPKNYTKDKSWPLVILYAARIGTSSKRWN
jgi:hypothetical protein